ncbi:hypothetical protein ACH4JZ_16880 [Streptomyces sp. NPDC017615]|uniref:hypothetical protein n=1 Tax=Streptomyces sp. NPDC017615 TaxID=3365003 RepID=UPI0037A4AA4F
MSEHAESATGADRHDKPTHAGNETVNDGPQGEDSAPLDGERKAQDEAGEAPAAPAAPAAQETEPDAPEEPRAGSGPDGTRELDLDGFERLLGLTAGPAAGPAGGRRGIETDGLDDGLGSDEQALRRLLHSAVEDVEPRTGSLEHLRRAVPARRARKRHAAVGMAAAALLLGTAIPALVHVSNSGTDPNTAMAGQSELTQGTEGRGRTSDGATGDTRGATGDKRGQGKDDDKKDKPGKKDGDKAGSAGAADPSASLAAGTAVCTPAQLGVMGSANGPDSGGVVYGTFRVSNVSGTPCTVSGTGQVGAVALGAADQAKLGVTAHVSGDGASGLPDPSLTVSSLVLQPGAAYAEQFAFVPSETCPVTGGGTTTTGGGSATGGDPSPDPTPSQDPGTTGTTDTGGTVGAAPQLLTVDGPADGSVQVTYATASGAGSSAVVSNACAGTVYYSGMQSAG